jgi:hypothetical protein
MTRFRGNLLECCFLRHHKTAAEILSRHTKIKSEFIFAAVSDSRDFRLSQQQQQHAF